MDAFRLLHCPSIGVAKCAACKKGQLLFNNNSFLVGFYSRSVVGFRLDGSDEQENHPRMGTKATSLRDWEYVRV